MFSWGVIFLVITALIGYYIIQQMFLRRRGYPPGPRPLPLIGNFHQIDLAYPHRTMLQWKRKYGGIFTVWLPKPIIVLAEFDAFKEALIKQGHHL
uniref:Cytochrome P450 n=1 Tax=Ascaris lumbricoides TaxID=6252 RepID=A0A0M3INE7_ASCLU